MAGQGPLSPGGAGRTQPQRQPPQKPPDAPEAPNLTRNQGRGTSLILGTNEGFRLSMQTPGSLAGSGVIVWAFLLDSCQTIKRISLPPS